MRFGAPLEKAGAVPSSRMIPNFRPWDRRHEVYASDAQAKLRDSIAQRARDRVERDRLACLASPGIPHVTSEAVAACCQNGSLRSLCGQRLETSPIGLVCRRTGDAQLSPDRASGHAQHTVVGWGIAVHHSREATPYPRVPCAAGSSALDGSGRRQPGPADSGR